MNGVFRSKWVLVALGVVALALAGTAYATIPGSNGTINACYVKAQPHSLRLADPQAGETCRSWENSVTWNQQGPPGPQGPAGPEGPAGPKGPSGVIQSTGASGGGPNPSSTLQFFGAPVSVFINSATERVFVVSWNAFGTGSLPAAGLNLYVCYQQQPSGAVTSVGNGMLGLQLPANTRVPMGVTKVLQLAAGFNYSVGMCGTGGANWTNNDWGQTSVFVSDQA